ncbi:MAG: spondin domain-containing protein [Nitrosomonadales bacterium]|nr:spondin domain-containing protein [Nitrosomonadales bacterium]
MRNSFQFSGTLLALAAAILVAACGGSSSATTAPPAKFDVTLTNLTAGQPMSPQLAIVHGNGFSLFSIGQPASVELEHLGEGGETAPLVTLASASAGYLNSAVGSGIVAPGASSTVTLSVEQANLASAKLSLASMLVNTNDAIAAVDAQSLSGLTAGSSISLDLASYDIGTEANTETAATIPGPAGGGAGFNAARDDVRNAVYLHPGVVTASDGLSGSALNAVHRWDNPVARIKIVRVQ